MNLYHAKHPIPVLVDYHTINPNQVKVGMPMHVPMYYLCLKLSCLSITQFFYAYSRTIGVG